jgi:hypothetical protein
MACAAGFTVVHAWTYSEALNDKAHHHTPYEALWQAVFYDFMIGIPVAALCGWAVASLIRVRHEAQKDRGTSHQERGEAP